MSGILFFIFASCEQLIIDLVMKYSKSSVISCLHFMQGNIVAIQYPVPKEINRNQM